MRSFAQSFGHFHWQAGDLQHVPAIYEDASDMLTMQDFVSRKFPIRQDHPGLYPKETPFHPDEIHNQMTHRGTYDPREKHGEIDKHYEKIGKHHELLARRKEYLEKPYDENPHMQSIDQHEDYKGDSRPYNSYLREPAHHRGDHISVPGYEGSPGHRIRKFAAMDRITDHPTVKPMSLYRGFGRNLDLRKMEPGHEFVDHGYTGLSNRRDLASSYSEGSWTTHHDPLMGHKAIAMVHVPSGTRGHLLDLTHFGGPVTPLHREHEFLLHRGTRFRVMGHSRAEVNDEGWASKLHVVHLQVTGQHPLPIHEHEDIDNR